jgi:3-hydroxybutyryl-CoA dehydrogenase
MSEPARWPGRILVVGAGIMGSGIAVQCALAGHEVVLEDVSEELARKGLANGLRALERHAERSGVDRTRVEAAKGRITPLAGLVRLPEGIELVIEAAPEDLAIKRRVFAELERAVPPTAALASNTSSLPITSIGQDLADPGRLVGLHFFNPVLQMPLVELIGGAHTRPELLDRCRTFAEELGKTVVTSKDTPGFVTTRALAVLVNEAAWMLYEHVATRDDIDAAYKLGFHHPMGPFELVDLVGIDTAVAILDVLWDGFRDSRYRACPLLRTMVAAKKLGRKTGEGFYVYPPRAERP